VTPDPGPKKTQNPAGVNSGTPDPGQLCYFDLNVCENNFHFTFLLPSQSFPQV